MAPLRALAWPVRGTIQTMSTGHPWGLLALETLFVGVNQTNSLKERDQQDVLLVLEVYCLIWRAYQNFRLVRDAAVTTP